LKALVIPKRQALTQHQGLLAPSAEAAELCSFSFSKAALNAYLQVDWVYTLSDAPVRPNRIVADAMGRTGMPEPFSARQPQSSRMTANLIG